MTFRSPRGGEGCWGVRWGLWDGESVLGRESSKCKGPEVGSWGILELFGGNAVSKWEGYGR